MLTVRKLGLGYKTTLCTSLQPLCKYKATLKPKVYFKHTVEGAWERGPLGHKMAARGPTPPDWAAWAPMEMGKVRWLP